ncbi:tetratricopeptide repeat protein [bacterium]|nr:tetratricopeptide repeat protein [bacterium]
MKRFVTVAGGILLVAILVITGCSNKPSEEELFSKAKAAQESRDFTGAVDAYKLVVANYPDGDRADEAQFMVGFLYANDIGDTTAARTAYEVYLEKYAARSDSGMVLSAKWELSNLGKDVDQIEEIMNFAGGESDSEAAE